MGSWINGQRMQDETASMGCAERAQYLSGILAGLNGMKRPDSICGWRGWDIAMDGKRYAERMGLDCEDQP